VRSGKRRSISHKEVEQLARSRNRACRRRQRFGAPAGNAREGATTCCRNFRQLPKSRTFLQELTCPHQAPCGWNWDCGHRGAHERGPMLKITRAANGEVVFIVSGRLDAENLEELGTLFRSEVSGRRIALDLTELTLVDQDAVLFLGRCEAENIRLRNCPAYIREWITRERGQS